MSNDLAEQLFAAMEATWPAAESRVVGNWLIRDGAGGGQRVSAASLIKPANDFDIDQAEAEMRALEQPLLFQLKPHEVALDKALEERGYVVRDPVNLYVGNVSAALGSQDYSNNVYRSWPPLAIQRDIWAEGGIGAARVAVMERACDPKTSFLGRVGQSAAGTAFVSIHEDLAMIHALEVLKTMRKKGAASQIMTGIANWAQDVGAQRLCLAVTQENFAANELYVKKGMRIAAAYHYRRAPI